MSHMPLTRLHLFIFRNLAILNEITECNSAAVAFINSKGVLVAFGWHWHWHWGSFSCQHWLTLALVPVLFLPSLGFRSCAVASLPIEAGCDCVNDIPTTIVDLVKVRIYVMNRSFSVMLYNNLYRISFFQTCDLSKRRKEALERKITCKNTTSMCKKAAVTSIWMFGCQVWIGLVWMQSLVWFGLAWPSLFLMPSWNPIFCSR